MEIDESRAGNLDPFDIARSPATRRRWPRRARVACVAPALASNSATLRCEIAMLAVLGALDDERGQLAGRQCAVGLQLCRSASRIEIAQEFFHGGTAVKRVHSSAATPCLPNSSAGLVERLSSECRRHPRLRCAHRQVVGGSGCRTSPMVQGCTKPRRCRPNLGRAGVRERPCRGVAQDHRACVPSQRASAAVSRYASMTC